MKSPSVCQACGREWDKHPGIQLTCRENQRLREIIRRARVRYGFYNTYGDTTAAEMFEILGEVEVEK